MLASFIIEPADGAFETGPDDRTARIGYDIPLTAEVVVNVRFPFARNESTQHAEGPVLRRLTRTMGT